MKTLNFEPTFPTYQLRCSKKLDPRNGWHQFDDNFYIENGHPVMVCRFCHVSLHPRLYGGKIIPRNYTMLIEEQP